MRVRILLQIATDDDLTGEIEELASLTKEVERAEDVGLSIAESKALLTAVQRRIVSAQSEAWCERQRCCATCNRRRCSKGSYPIVFHTLFGDVPLESPRFYRCACREMGGPATIAPLRQLLPDHVAPERLYLESRWASLVSYAAAAEMLADVLPVNAGVNAMTLRAHALRVAERAEAGLGEEQYSFIEGCPANWQKLPLPEGRIVVGLDGGYLRDWNEKKANFEVIVGRSLPEDRAARYVGLVHGHDQKPKRRLVEMLKAQGLKANQDITFLTDGGEEVRAMADFISPCSEHVLDWFHIAMRLTVLGQYAKGVAQCDPSAGALLLTAIERIKWLLWHGNRHRSRQVIEDLVDDAETLDVDYPNQRRFAKAAHEFSVYIAANAGSLINYGERFRAGERISTGFVESTVNAVISKRFAKRQQMQWTRRGAHLLLQTRTRTLDGTLRPMFESWYPGLGNGAGVNRAVAA